MEFATLTSNLTVKLPAEVAKRFKPSDRFVVATDGDTLILKRVLPSITEIVGHAESGEPLSLDEINDIVHQIRKERRSKQS
jgi:hypothetical protein